MLCVSAMSQGAGEILLVVWTVLLIVLAAMVIVAPIFIWISTARTAKAVRQQSQTLSEQMRYATQLLEELRAAEASRADAAK
jgi:ABC-type bacteriocin/lantibiotic exporter with double-glycine peptidase domain